MYTLGAEIAGICRTAAAYTLKQQIDLSDIKSFKVDRSQLKVKMEHFRYAVRNVFFFIFYIFHIFKNLFLDFFRFTFS